MFWHISASKKIQTISIWPFSSWKHVPVLLALRGRSIIFLSVAIFCSSELTVSLGLLSWKTVRFSKQMSNPCIFSCQMLVIIYRTHRRNVHSNYQIFHQTIFQSNARTIGICDKIYKTRVIGTLKTWTNV